MAWGMHHRSTISAQMSKSVTHSCLALSTRPTWAGHASEALAVVYGHAVRLAHFAADNPACTRSGTDTWAPQECNGCPESAAVVVQLAYCLVEVGTRPQILRFVLQQV